MHNIILYNILYRVYERDLTFAHRKYTEKFKSLMYTLYLNTFFYRPLKI